MAGLDPAGSARFRDRAGAYRASLEALDREFRSGLGTCGSRAFFYCGHSAFGYLARRYGLEQIAVFGTSPDAAPTPRALASIIDRVQASAVRTVFFEDEGRERRWPG